MKVLSNVLKVILKIVMVVVFIGVMVSSTIGLGFVYTRYVDNDEEPNAFDIFENSVPKEKINVLVLGTNQNLTDFIVVAGYNPETGKLSMISVPRDTKYGNANTAYSKINAIYQGKHIDKLKQEVESLLGIEINNYVIFDKQALWDVVDALGGVTVDVGPKALKYSDPEQNLYINLEPGVQVLDGKKAEQYVRYRKGYAEGDIGRIKAQQNFINSFIKECMKTSNIPKLPKVVNIGFEHIKTDLTVDTVLYYLEDVSKFKMENVRMETLPGEPKTLDGVSFYIPFKNKAQELVDEMFNNIVKEQEGTSSQTSTKVLN